MIKIISGTYGMKKNGKIIPKNSSSEPFEIEADEERKLVELGVAEYVTASEDKKSNEPPKSADDNTKQTAKLEDMSGKQLKAYAKEHNIKLPKSATSKSDIVEAIKSAENNNDNGDSEQTNSEAAPVINAQMPI